MRNQYPSSSQGEDWRKNCACCRQGSFLPLAVMVGGTPVCDDCRPKWGDGFVKAYEQDMEHMKAFLEFTLYADEETIRLLTLVESGEPMPVREDLEI
jgi:hypothetical protein